MSRRSTKHSGNKTSPAQRRINQDLSVAALSRLLQLNFSGGACLIVLTYDLGGYCPVGAYAEPDIVDWLRLCRQQVGGAFPYVRTMEQDRAAVHRVITVIPKTAAEGLAARWKYGPVRVEEIEGGQLPALAEQFAGKAEAHRHSWSASKGLKRV